MPDLVGTSREEGAKVKRLAHSRDDLGERALGAELLALFLDFSVTLETSKTVLERNGDGNDGVAGCVLLDPFGDLGKVLVLLSDVIFLAEVDEEDDGLGAEEQ